MTVIVEKTSDRPIVDLLILSPSGGFYDAPARRGEGYLTTLAMLHQTRRYSRASLSKALLRLGSSFNISSTLEAMRVEFSVLESHFDDAVSLLKEVLRAPRFTSAALAKCKREVLATLDSIQDDDGYCGINALRHLIFGGQAYGWRMLGSHDEVMSITTDQVTARYRRAFSRSRPLVAGLATGLDPEAAAQRVLSALGRQPFSGDKKAWTGGPPTRPLKRKATALIIHRPERKQASLYFGAHSEKNRTRHLLSLRVADSILGGGFVSRLVKEVRVERGLSYSTYSNWEPYRHAGIFFAHAHPENAAVGDTLKVMSDVIEDYREHGPSSAELNQMKRSMIRGYPFLVDTPLKRLEAVVDSHFFGMRKRINFAKAMRAITLSQVRSVAKKKLIQGPLHCVVVGDARQLEKSVTQALPNHDVILEA